MEMGTRVGSANEGSAAEVMDFSGRPLAHVQPGQVVVSMTPRSLVTILGSCVAVCVYDPVRRVGGLNHYLLPGNSGETQSTRSGPGAMRRLLEELSTAGAIRERLVAKVFGGACVLGGEARSNGGHLGRENVRVALDALELAGIPVVAEDVCGTRGRKLIFHSDTGDARMREQRQAGATAYPAAWPDATVAPLTEREFSQFRSLVRATAGINLTPSKKALLVGRLVKRLRACRLDSFGEYYRLAEQDDAERQRMIDAICTNETHFFREPRQFDFLAGRVVPLWCDELRAGKRPPRVRIWSAACSTGEEPYSLAMALLDRLPPSAGWQIQILASDLSSRVLAKAREATWPIAQMHEIPMPYLRRFMLRGTRTEEGLMCAGSEIREVVEFSSLNLMDRSYQVGAPFDAIFCRNVLIYFDAETKAGVVGRLIPHLLPGGLLFLGQAESLAGVDARLRGVGPSVYARSDAPAASTVGRGRLRREP